MTGPVRNARLAESACSFNIYWIVAGDGGLAGQIQ